MGQQQQRKYDAAADPAVEAIEYLGETTARALDTTAARLDKLERKQTADVRAIEDRLGRVTGTSRGGAHTDLTWIPESHRAALYAVGERGVRSDANPRNRLESDAAFRTNAAAFLLASSMAQNPRLSGVYQGQWAELLGKAYRSFGIDIEKAAALTTGTDGLGGHWVPDPVALEIWRLVTDNSVFGRLARNVPMSSKTLDLPVEGSSALSVAWGAENTDIADSVPASNAVAKVTLTANRLNGFAKASLESIQDSAASIIDFVLTVLAEKSGREIDKQVLEGTGSPFTGIAGASGVNEVTTGANGDALTFPVLANLVFKARERASRDNARFFLAPEAMQKIIGLVDSQGMPIVQYGSVAGPMATSILGFPAEIHSVIRADRTYGTGTTLSNVYFGPPSAVVLGNRTGMSWDVSDVPGFRDYSLHMRLVTRVGFGLAVPGAWSRHTNLDV